TEEKALDRRSDVYSLGATLWELLALGPLYGATEQTPRFELMKRIQATEPGRLCREVPAVSRDLEAVVLKCLEKEPGGRYATARDWADDLGRFLDGEPVSARPVSSVERGWKWAKRRPLAAALVGVSSLMMVALLVLIGGSFFYAKLQEALRTAESEREIANAARVEADKQRGLAVAAGEEKEAAREKE